MHQIGGGAGNTGTAVAVEFVHPRVGGHNVELVTVIVLVKGFVDFHQSSTKTNDGTFLAIDVDFVANRKDARGGDQSSIKTNGGG